MLELRDIARQWDHRPLLDGVDLRVAAGQTVALLGASGSGKSTLLNIIAGLEVPESGRVWLDGQDISDWPPERRRLALMFQDFALFPHLNLQDNVAFGLVEQGVTRNVARTRADDLLQRFGLGGRGQERVGTLSGGEQQRVALARAFVVQPKLLLADEPTGSLDAQTGESIMDLMLSLNQARGTTLILVTHDQKLAQRCNRTLTLRAGQLISQG